MKGKTRLLAARLAFLTVTAGVTTSFGQDLFHANELSADALGFYSSRDKDGHGSAAGIGLGVNYYFNEYLGAGADTYADAFTVPYLLNGSLLARYPLENTQLAPYGFAGFGRQWEHAAQWTGHIGAGLEYRLTDTMGFLVDIRGVFPDRTKDYTLIRFGFRFVVQ